MTSPDTQKTTYKSILSTLLPSPPSTTSTSKSTSIKPPFPKSKVKTLPLPLYPSPVHTPTPLHPTLTPQIASLRLHPSLEAALHILNNDLPAAHFLVRHMQDVVPRDEGERRAREKERGVVDGGGGGGGGEERTGSGDGDGDGDEKDREVKEVKTDGEHECKPRRKWAQLAAGDGGEAAASERSVDANNVPSHRSSSEDYSSSSSKSSISTNTNHNHNHNSKRPTPPKLEGLLLHALLHRIEGDYENARAWYSNVDAASLKHRPSSSHSAKIPAAASGNSSNDEQNSSADDYKDAWTSIHPRGLSPVHHILDRIIALRARIHPSPSPPNVLPASASDADRRELAELEQWHWEECRAVARWCEGRYGWGVWEDGREEFVSMMEGHREIAGRMITGGEGWRQF